MIWLSLSLEEHSLFVFCCCSANKIFSADLVVDVSAQDGVAFVTHLWHRWDGMELFLIRRPNLRTRFSMRKKKVTASHLQVMWVITTEIYNDR